MGRRFLMVALGIGAIAGFGSGFSHLARARWAAQHGGYDCGWSRGGYGYDNRWDNDARWGNPPPVQQAPVVQQQAPIVQPQSQPQVIIVQQPAPVMQQPAQQSPVIVVQPQLAQPQTQTIVVPQAQPNGGTHTP